MVFGEFRATPQMNSKVGEKQRLHSQQTKCWQRRRLLCPWSLVLGPRCYYETTILWINNITRDRQWSWRQTWPALQNCHLSSKEWLPRKNKELLLSMRSQEAPPSKLLSRLFLKIKGSRCKGDPDFAFVCQSWLSARENVAKESLLTGGIETTWERGEASQRKL